MNYIKKKSKAQESRTAKEFFEGRTTPASGALDGFKGDVRTPFFLIENKFTDKDFYKLELKTWIKIWKEATKDSLRTPLMQIDIQDLQLVLGNIYDVEEHIIDYPKSIVNAVDLKGSYQIKKSTFDSYEAIALQFPKHTLLVIKKQLFLDANMQT